MKSVQAVWVQVILTDREGIMPDVNLCQVMYGLDRPPQCTHGFVGCPVCGSRQYHLYRSQRDRHDIRRMCFDCGYRGEKQKEIKQSTGGYNHNQERDMGLNEWVWLGNDIPDCEITKTVITDTRRDSPVGKTWNK